MQNPLFVFHLRFVSAFVPLVKVQTLGPHRFYVVSEGNLKRLVGFREVRQKHGLYVLVDVYEIMP